MGFPTVGVAGVGAPPACVGEAPLPQPVHQGTAVRACRQFQDELGVHVIGIGRIPFGCHGVALLGAPRRHGERIPLWARPEPEEGIRTQAGVVRPGGGKHSSVGDTSPARGAPRASSPCRLMATGTNRQKRQSRLCYRFGPRGRRPVATAARSSFRTPTEHPTGRGSWPMTHVGAPDLTVRSAGRPRMQVARDPTSVRIPGLLPRVSRTFQASSSRSSKPPRSSS